MKSIKQRIIDKGITFTKACEHYYNELTEEDIDYIVEKDPWGATLYLNNHPFLNQKHIDFIVKITYFTPTKHISHRLSEENIIYLAENHPEQLKGIFQ